MARPNLLCIGAQKSGTSALYWLMSRHDSCVVGTIKESHFFVDESPWPFGNWHRGIDWYERLYPQPGVIVADISPSYAGWPLFPGVVDRAKQTLPDATIVYLVRDPIDRVVAHWRHWIARGYDNRPFAEAVLDPDPMNQYVIGSSYATQLDQWRAQYDDAHIITMHQDEVRTGAERLFAHFGIPPLAQQGRSVNVSDRLRATRTWIPERVRPLLPHRLATRPVNKPAVTADVAAALLDRLGPEAERFESMTGLKVLRPR